jgi:pectate lyase
MVSNIMKKLVCFLLLALPFSHVLAQPIEITQAKGWLESAYITWNPLNGAESYNVYYTGNGFTNKQIDTQLIRSYGTYFRADILGLAAGDYTIAVTPVIEGVEGNPTTSQIVSVLPHDRAGFAHSNGRVPGGYNMDGTVKANAVILYITEDTKNTISLTVTGANSNPCVGLQTILDGFKKGNDNRPLIVRLLGNITDADYLLNGDIVIENNKNSSGSITFEGVGSDAVANGWGVRLKKASNVEVRNMAFMLTNSAELDNIGLQQENEYIWVHHCDLFYGMPGSASDQTKGDGALDTKKSTYVTISYNHFWDTGKSCLLGLGENTTEGLFVTYHHNWFDHSDSRHPRVRFYSAHVYNNYFDGISKYGVGSTLGSSVFVEGNYFRNCKYPMLISKQGTDILGGSSGTFSGEDGGIIKAYNNYMVGQSSFLPYNATTNPAQFDAYVASTRDEVLGNNITSFQGGNSYNNFDTDPTLYIHNLTIDEPELARDKVMQYAGRVSGGDLNWTFNNAVDDTSYDLNQGLFNMLADYTTSLVYVQGIDGSSGSTQTLDIPSNNVQTVLEGNPISNMVFTWGGTATDVTVTGLPSNGIDFEKNMTAKTITVNGTPTDNVTFTVTTSGPSGTPVSGSGNIYIGSSEGVEIHNFTVSGLSSSFYTFTSANMNSTPSHTTYDGLVLTARLKIETATLITYSTSAVSTLTLVFDPGFSGKIRLNNVSYTAVDGVATIPNIPAGENSITKDNVANLYYIKTAYSTLDVDNPLEEMLTLYPNPVANDLNIRVRDNITIERISIYNSTGQLVKRVEGNSTIINLSHLNSGIYLVILHTNRGAIKKKVIKN